MSTDQMEVLLNVLTITGGLLLWLGFLLLGVVARRYEQVFQQSTSWQGLMTAPIGIPFYVLVSVWHLSPSQALEVISQIVLLLSGACTWIFVMRFHRLVQRVTKGVLP